MDGAGKVRFASEQADGSALVIQGDIFADFQVTKERADIQKRLAPIVPSMIWGIGLNYKFHAQESNAKLPMLFAKGPNAVQNPEDPIQDSDSSPQP